MQAARRENLTKELIKNLAPGRQRFDVHDTKERGLVLTVHPSGAKVYYMVLRVQGRAERYRIGNADEIAPEKARRKAAWFRAEAADGKNPADVKRGKRAEPTLGDVWRAFETYHENAAKPRKNLPLERYFWRNHIEPRLGAKRFHEITRQDVARMHHEVSRPSPVEGRQRKRGGPIAANRVRQLMGSLYLFWEEQQGVEIPRPYPPKRGLRNDERPRSRYLSRAELRSFWTALLGEADRDARDMLALMLLTGLRKGNARTARWEHMRLTGAWPEWRIPGTQMKNGEELLLPLAPAVAGILKARWRDAGEPAGGWVFPGVGTAGAKMEPRSQIQRVFAVAQLADFVPHDLRRSYITYAEEGGVRTAVCRLLTAHKEGDVHGRHYRQVSPEDARAGAVHAERYILSLAGLAADDFALGCPGPDAMREEPRGAEVVRLHR